MNDGLKNKPILFLDSGLGGIPYCQNFHRRNPSEALVYLADREKYPYGPRRREELVKILISLMEELIAKFDPKIAVLACNTASVSALSELRERFSGIPFVGTVPAVKPAIKATKAGKIAVIATERTISDPFIKEQAGDTPVMGIPAPRLVEFVERRFLTADQNEKESTAKEYIDMVRSGGADVLVLACTHFLLLRQEFIKIGAPDIQIVDSIDGVTGRVETILGENALAAEREGPAGNLFLITGKEPPDTSWLHWAEFLGFPLALLADQ